MVPHGRLPVADRGRRSARGGDVRRAQPDPGHWPIGYRRLLPFDRRSLHAARALANARSFVVFGSGIDAISARELALKIEEGVRLPAVARETETELHGHLVSANGDAALIGIVTEPRATAARAARADQLLRAGRADWACRRWRSCRVRRMRSWPDSATDARIVMGDTSHGSIVEALLASAVALQLLTLELLTLHDRNPDLIGRENVDQREAAAIASAELSALERRPRDDVPVGIGHRHRPLTQQRVDPAAGRIDLDRRQQLAQRLPERGVHPVAHSSSVRTSSSSSGSPRQPHNTVRSFGSTAKQTPWSQPWIVPVSVGRMWPPFRSALLRIASSSATCRSR